MQDQIHQSTFQHKPNPPHLLHYVRWWWPIRATCKWLNNINGSIRTNRPTLTNTTGATGRTDPWRCNNSTGTAISTATHRPSTGLTSHNGLHNNILPNSSDHRNNPICFRCGEQGHMRSVCRERVFCDHCKTYNHDTKACRKQHNNIPSTANSQITAGYHPTATPPHLMGTTTTTTQQAGIHNNNPLFKNLLDNNQLRTSTMIQTPHNGTSPTTPADLVEGITQIMNQVTNNNKRDDASKQMMKNIKIFDGSNKAKCINWLSQLEAAARFTNTPFCELICQSMAPTMLHIFSELSALASDEEIKEAILTNYSDIRSTTEAATRLQNIQISASKPLVTFNHRYEAIHKVALSIPTRQQENKTVIIEYAKKLPVNTRDKLLRKNAKKNSYIKTLHDAFKQTIDINRETSFVEAATGRYNNQIGTKIETQINELEHSFQEYDINVMNTKSTNRPRDGSWNGSFDRSSHRNNSFNSSQNSRSNYRGTPATMIHRIDKASAETTAETEDTNNNLDMNREARTTRTGMTTIKIEIGLTTEEDQTNINTTEMNTKHRSFSNSQIKTWWKWCRR